MRENLGAAQLKKDPAAVDDEPVEGSNATTEKYLRDATIACQRPGKEYSRHSMILLFPANPAKPPLANQLTKSARRKSRSPSHCSAAGSSQRQSLEGRSHPSSRNMAKLRKR